MEDSVFYSGPSFNVVSDNVGLVTRKENYAKQILSISSLVSYWRLGDYAGISQYSQNIRNDSPIGYWRLNDSSGAANELIAQKNGTPHGTITYGQSSPLADTSKSVLLDGTTAYFNTLLNVGGLRAITFEAWVNHGGVAWSASHEQVLASNNAGLYMSVNNGHVFMSVNPVVQVTAIGPIVPTTGWQHIVCTFDGAVLRTYLNGVAGGTNTSDSREFSRQTGLINIGTFDQASFFYGGLLGELAVYNYALTQGQIMAHYATGIGKYAMTVLGDTPMAYWRLDDTGTIAQDYSAKGGNPGAIIGTVTKGVTGATTESDTAMTFDGATAEIDLQNRINLSGMPYSVEFWINIPSIANIPVSTFNRVLEAAKGNPANGFRIFTFNNSGVPGLAWEMHNNNINVTSFYSWSYAYSLPLGQWAHIVFVWDGTSQKMYSNGSLVATVTPPPGTTQGNSIVAATYIGADNGGNFLNGSLDELAIYGTALSAQQAFQHYAAGLGKFADSKVNNHAGITGTVISGFRGVLPGDKDSAANTNATGNLWVSHSGALVPANISVEVWAKNPNPTTFDTILTKSSLAAWTDGYGMYYRSGNGMAFWVSNYNTGSSFIYDGWAGDTNWHHWVGTYDGANVKIYRDGVLRGQSAYAGPINYVGTPDLTIGTGPGSPFWRGQLDEMAIYNTALSPQQILANYNTGVSSPGRLIDIYGA